jgi:hypothetical protein
MTATYHWCEDNGAATGGHGTTRSGFPADTHYATDCNWKNIDDCTSNGGTAYSSSPITAGNNSYTKYQYLHFIGGTFNQISSCKFTAHDDASAFGAGLTLKGTVSTTYATPATGVNAALTTDFTSQVAVASGIAVLFSTTGPEGAGPASTLAADGYTQYFATQLQTAGGAAPGDTNQVTLKVQYNEN